MGRTKGAKNCTSPEERRERELASQKRFAKSEKRIAYRKTWSTARSRARREFYLNKLGPNCVRCGSTDRCQFDHIDPESKDREIAWIWTGSVEVLEQELSKCQILCWSCHHAKTGVERRIFSNTEVLEILAEAAAGKSNNQISKERGCSSVTIDAIVNRKYYKQIEI